MANNNRKNLFNLNIDETDIDNMSIQDLKDGGVEKIKKPERRAKGVIDSGVARVASGVGGLFSFMNMDSGTVLRVFLILLLLSILGFNILTHLDEVGDAIGEIVRPITNYIFGVTGEVTKQTVKTAAVGSKAGIDIAAGTATGGIDLLAQTIDDGANTVTHNRINDRDIRIPDQGRKNRVAVLPDEIDSDIQQSGKSGYCYVGSENGVRNCIEVGRNDSCMSGDIFPTRDVCINPNLRE